MKHTPENERPAGQPGTAGIFIVVAVILILVLALGIWLAWRALQGPPVDPAREPIREDRKYLGDIPLADYLPPPASRSNLDPFTRESLALLDAWFTDAKKMQWPSTLVFQGEDRPSASERRLRVRFAKTLTLQVLEVTGEPPVVEILTPDGKKSTQVKLGRMEGGKLTRFATVAPVRAAFANLDQLGEVRELATGEPFLRRVDLEAGVKEVAIEDQDAPPGGGARFAITVRSPVFVLHLRQGNGQWQIERIQPDS